MFIYEVNYDNNKIHGYYDRFYPNGQLESRVSYVQGLKHGPSFEYYPDQSLALEGYNENGLFHGAFYLYYHKDYPNPVDAAQIVEIFNHNSKNKIDVIIIQYEHGKLQKTTYLDADGQILNFKQTPVSTTNLAPILQDSAHYFPQGLIRFCQELGLKLERPSQSELDRQAAFFRHWFGYDMPQELNLFYHLSSQADIPNFFFKKKFGQANPLGTWQAWENSGENPALQGILEHQRYYPRTHLPHWFYGFMPLTAPNFSNRAYYQEYAYHVQTQMGEKQGQVFGLSERKPQQSPYAESVHSIRPQTFAANLNDLFQALHLLHARWTLDRIELDNFFSIWNEDTKGKVNFDYYMFSDMRYVKNGRTNWWYPDSTASHLKPNEEIRNYMQHNLWIVSWLTGEVPVSQITDQIRLYKHSLIQQAFQNQNNPPQILHGLWAQFLLQGPHLKAYLDQAKKQPSALVRHHAELIEMLHQGQLNELGFRLNVQADLEAFDKHRHIAALRAEIS